MFRKTCFNPLENAVQVTVHYKQIPRLSGIIGGKANDQLVNLSLVGICSRSLFHEYFHSIKSLLKILQWKPDWMHSNMNLTCQYFWIFSGVVLGSSCTFIWEICHNWGNKRGENFKPKFPAWRGVTGEDFCDSDPSVHDLKMRGRLLATSSHSFIRGAIFKHFSFYFSCQATCASRDGTWHLLFRASRSNKVTSPAGETVSLWLQITL